jgi:hypothetical protein
MHQRSDPLGTCPHCGAALYQRDVLVEYDADANTRYYAECPGCETVVHPE